MAHVINATENDTGFWFELGMMETCTWEPRPTLYYKVWDQFGPVHDRVLRVDTAKATQSYWVPLPGVGPWMFLGEHYACSQPTYSYAHNITSGFRVFAGRLGDGSTTQKEDVHRMTIPAGGTRTETAWEGWPLTYRGFGAFVEVSPRGWGGFAGTVQMRYPDGTLWREDTFSMTGVQSADFTPMQYYPGKYPIIAEMGVPSTQDVEITYYVMHEAHDERLCELGFQWEMCQTE